MKIKNIAEHFVPSSFSMFDIIVMKFNPDTEQDELVVRINKSDIRNADSFWWQWCKKEERVKHWLVTSHGSIKIWLAN